MRCIAVPHSYDDDDYISTIVSYACFGIRPRTVRLSVVSKAFELRALECDRRGTYTRPGYMARLDTYPRIFTRHPVQLLGALRDLVHELLSMSTPRLHRRLDEGHGSLISGRGSPPRCTFTTHTSQFYSHINMRVTQPLLGWCNLHAENGK